ncbi:MAG: hypothetical protein J7463_14800 [Roseiflexus sp.]|jgi:DNA-binding transcriptional MerR regulator|uniref:chaperone modulator CbpM n=1 Tax=Roseiflexus sp. (strain RS-1) TaxID=357808 RepID=UPI0000D7FA29|nr:chaperone modulator CbpM [Roseiflexus sp. RS-1]MBO9322977.1 hypothetical protein [Roseiflexus sp.]ABQ91458.1 hypothetical protein RoseRS_3095 [Roseiflexus sp. RS-1]MBO9326587.1 hypothetical protein [Roseiflexus sp.]MBO9366002.1 hypothetical protein [Roseiflexus sp.]MBO9382629.1 hypothetical protein [Roseiflexus sp.]
MLIRRINPETLAAQTGLPVEVIQELIDLGLIGTLPEPTETDLRELRRVRRLIDTLGLSHEAVDVILQMRRRLVALQNEVAQLRMELSERHRVERTSVWIEAEWVETRE